jgi:hypothetical protein
LKPVAHGETVASVQQVASLAKAGLILLRFSCKGGTDFTGSTAHFSLFFLTTNTRLFKPAHFACYARE